MLDNVRLEQLLFLDIETVPQHPDYGSLDARSQYLWDKKAKIIARGDAELTPESIYDRAGIYAEFGKICVISVGYISSTDGVRQFRAKSFADHDEKKLLTEFIGMMNKHYSSDRFLLCAHNGKEFDFPYIARRLLINGLKLPAMLDIAGKKPWEIRHIDTMELWKFGDFKAYTSIEILTHVFNIPTPKDDIDGSQVYRVYYEENDLERIKLYCEKDTLTVAQLVLKFKGEELIDPDQFISSGS
jgi:DNA polymerase elongation subunit (family B)